MLHRAVGHDTLAVPGANRLVDWVVGSALLLPIEAFRMVGGYEDAFFMSSEEIEPIGVGGVPAQVIDSGPLPGDGS